MASMKYWLWLTTRGLSAHQCFLLQRHFGSPEAVFFSEDAALRQVEGLRESSLQRLRDKSLDTPRKILEDCYEKQIRLLTIDDGEYPERLRNIYDPPLVLYVRGQLPPIQEMPALAVVGTRQPGPGGERPTRTICRELAAAGMLLVSGMALGIDAAAHEGALEVGMPTLAVLGGGVDVIYPPQHENLYHRILASGAVLSEYPPGAEPSGYHFPQRNRIITGLCDAVLVGKAPRRSGALISARLAGEQGREVFFLPGSIDDPYSEGSNALGADGARMVTCAADLLRDYLPLYPTSFRLRRKDAPKPAPQTPAPEKRTAPPPDNSGRLERLREQLSSYPPVQQALLTRLMEGACHVDTLMSLPGLTPPQVLGELTLLQLSGTVRQLPGKRFALKLD